MNIKGFYATCIKLMRHTFEEYKTARINNAKLDLPI